VATEYQFVNSGGIVVLEGTLVPDPAATSGVTSVFARAGAVAATTGDYTAAQVTNAADKSSASAQTFTGVVRPAAAAAATDAPKLSQISSALTITSGTLPNTGAWVSGTAKQNPVTRDITVAVEVVCDGTANAATCAIAISPDNTTFTTIATPGVSSAVNTVGGSTQLAAVSLPAGWYIKLTFSHATVAASIYY
jgi:hypothetical protein